MNHEPGSSHAGRGRLRHNNRPGDPQSAPRCGAQNRRGGPCQAPAMRGRTRCQLHGGKSTGPTTLEGLARLRAARTITGRWSAEGRAMEACCARKVCVRAADHSNRRLFSRSDGPDKTDADRWP